MRGLHVSHVDGVYRTKLLHGVYALMYIEDVYFNLPKLSDTSSNPLKMYILTGSNMGNKFKS